jgi:hypothetical protein
MNNFFERLGFTDKKEIPDNVRCIGRKTLQLQYARETIRKIPIETRAMIEYWLVTDEATPAKLQMQQSIADLQLSNPEIFEDDQELAKIIVLVMRRQMAENFI